MLVFGGVHVAAELVCGLPEDGLEAEVGTSVGGVAVRRAFCTCQANPSQDVLGDYGVFPAVLPGQGGPGAEDIYALVPLKSITLERFFDKTRQHEF